MGRNVPASNDVIVSARLHLLEMKDDSTGGNFWMRFKMILCHTQARE